MAATCGLDPQDLGTALLAKIRELDPWDLGMTLLAEIRELDPRDLGPALLAEIRELDPRDLGTALLAMIRELDPWDRGTTLLAEIRELDPRDLGPALLAEIRELDPRDLGTAFLAMIRELDPCRWSSTNGGLGWAVGQTNRNKNERLSKTKKLKKITEGSLDCWANHWYNPPHSPRTVLIQSEQKVWQNHSGPLTSSTLPLWTITVWTTLQSSEHQIDETQKHVSFPKQSISWTLDTKRGTRNTIIQLFIHHTYF